MPGQKADRCGRDQGRTVLDNPKGCGTARDSHKGLRGQSQGPVRGERGTERKWAKDGRSCKIKRSTSEVKRGAASANACLRPCGICAAVWQTPRHRSPFARATCAKAGGSDRVGQRSPCQAGCHSAGPRPCPGGWNPQNVRAPRRGVIAPAFSSVPNGYPARGTGWQAGKAEKTMEHAIGVDTSKSAPDAF